ncbi:MAG: prepilin-type N-terminal cleavage/methylation domain-containing protein [Lachnospiraceae bacterium]|nr:prepilin-type N-terminal cleavage/methylation domain-containing protein [Lachnospiraceae bacterium]MDY2758839.1 prepilin-type N-terminal cleavage/methylation domain-containing protein [Lachnospiraceae bacterium]
MNTKVAKKNNKGFTLIELIVVIAIIAVLAAILAPQYLRYVEKSRVTSDASTAKEIKNAVQTAMSDPDVSEILPVTVTWTGTDGKIKVGDTDIKDATGTGLAAELGKTFKEVPTMKSQKWKTYNNATYTVTVSDAGSGSVTLKEFKPS